MFRWTLTFALLGALVADHPATATETESSQAAQDVDSDGDGLPDDWEQRFGLSAFDPLDENGADGDPDLDGLSNLVEWRGGSHPRGFFRQKFAEGAVGPVFDTTIALVNAEDAGDATVVIRLLGPSGTVVGHVVSVPASSRRTVEARRIPGAPTEFSIEVESDRFIACERTMTWYGGTRDSHASGGIDSASQDWYFAEGTTHSGFQLFYLVANLGPEQAAVTVEYHFADGMPLRRTHLVEPHSRSTIWANVEDSRLASTEVAAHFSSSEPVVIERAMYSTAPDGTLLAGHAAAGVPAPSLAWYFAEGSTESNLETFLLLSNPGDTPARVEVRYLLPTGEAVVREHDVEPRRRFTDWVSHADPALADTAVAMHVRSLNAVPIVAERAMWWPGPDGRFVAGHLSAGVAAPSASWAFANADVDTHRGLNAYVLVGNVGDRDTWVRLRALRTSGPPVEADLFSLAGSRTNADMLALFPMLDGESFGVVLEARDPEAALVAELSQYVSEPGIGFRSGTTVVGQSSVRLLDIVDVVTIGNATATTLEHVVPDGVMLKASSSAPGLLQVEVTPGGGLRITSGVGSGWVTITVTAEGSQSREQRRVRVRVGNPQLMTHQESLSGAGTYLLPGTGSLAATYASTTIENAGSSTVTGIELHTLGRDWATVDSILTEATAGLTAADEKARALWQFARSHHVVWPSPTINTDIHDPVLLFNGIGFVYCDDIASALALLFERAGMPTRMWNLGVDQHTVVEAWYDNDWHMFDASLDGLYLERDNQTVAGVEDIVADLDLVRRGGWTQDYIASLWALPGHVSYASQPLTREGHRMGFTLRPGESLRLVPREPLERFYRDATVTAPEGVVPPVAGGEFRSRWLGTASGALTLLERGAGLTQTESGLRRTDSSSPGAGVVRVSSPWVILGGSLRATLDLGMTGETASIELSASGTSFDLDWSELRQGRYRVPGAFVSEDNTSVYSDGYFGPAVHNRSTDGPATLQYRIRPLRSAGSRTMLSGSFYRETADESVAVQVSSDGQLWRDAWRMAAVGGVAETIDLTDALRECETCHVRLEFTSRRGAGRAGIDALRLEGLEPFGWTPLWARKASEPSQGSVEVALPLDAHLRSFNGAMIFDYHIRVTIDGAGEPTATWQSLSLDTAIQVAPESLAVPLAEATTVVYRDTTTEPHDIRVTHRWYTDAGRHRPETPVPTVFAHGEPVDARKPFVLEWNAPPDPDGDTLITYHVQVCERPDCRYPISRVFDWRGTLSDTGADKVFGTPDDGPPIPIISTHLVEQHDWLRSGTAYYWRVRTQDATGLWSDFSPIAHFVVNESP